MKILQLSPQFPYPLSDGGKISIANMTRALVSASCEVTMFCLVSKMPTQSEIKAFEAYSGATCRCFVHDTRNTPLAILQSIFDFNNPLYIRKHRSAMLHQEIESFLKEESIDAILCDHTAMAESGLFASSIAQKPCIIRMHNIEHVIWERYANRLSFFDPRKWYVSSQAQKLRDREVALCAKANQLAMITEHDVNVISSMNKNIKASYIPVGVDMEYFKPSITDIIIHHRMIHATTYDWIHNVEALDWFIAEILPDLQKEYQADLVLLGKHMPEKYANGGTKGLIGKGYVPDINAELNQSAMYIAPLFVGGGIRIKILEAMSAGLPVIASPISAEGIKAKREDGLIICSTKQEWLREITRLIQNPNVAKELGSHAREFIKRNHSWDFSADKMKRLIQESYVR